ncbi:MAG: site-specific integrase [Rhodocyclaceae bacterium]|nr:MAG: site-specific integrase [Rhodocyclaceae bacterium]
MPIVQFTKEFMATGLVCPSHMKRIEYSVAGGPGGLFVECRPNAIPVWYVRMKNAKKTNVYRRLGTVAELTLKRAINQAALAKAEQSIMVKQAPEQKPAMGEMTLDTLWRLHYYPYACLHKRSHARDEQLYRIRIKPRFADCKLSEIMRHDVVQFQNELANEKLSPASQDHHLRLFRRLLGYSVELGLLEKNILKGIKLRLVDNVLHDVANSQQLSRLVEILRSDSNRPVCNILMFLLSTGARLGEARRATWDHVDMDRGLWTIPASVAKSKRARTVPLNRSAMYVLEEAGKMKKFETIFANPKTGKPFVTITRVWYRLRKEAGISKMRIHSCRHQFADLLLANGGSLYSVQILLGHSDPRVSQRYARLSMEAQRNAAGMASLFVPEAKPEAPKPAEDVPVPPKETPTANILQFSRAA